jgi:protein-disulfide isomerase
MKKEIKYLLAVVGIVAAASFGIYQSALKQNEKPQSITIAPNFPLITNLAANHSFSYGPENAKVTVVEFFDPECESCSAVSPYIKKEMKFYEGKVRWVFRYMPYHFNSKTAIAVLESARKQNLFLESMELLFTTQKKWGEKQVSMKNEIIEIVSRVPSMDKQRLLAELENPAIQQIIEQDAQEGKMAGVKGTPTFFVNGVILERLDLDGLIARINAELAK